MECHECTSLITDMEDTILSHGKILCSLNCYKWRSGKESYDLDKI